MTRDHVPASMQRRVRERAGHRCEYCRIAQLGQEATFHVDHIQPRREDGPTTLNNLALSCVSCSLSKGARTHASDPLTREAARIFNPRTERWSDHFELTAELLLVGTTPTGRATVELLRMNRPLAVAIRHEEVARNRYP